jgi:Fe-S cluster biogenesis protein NfuA
MIVIRRLRLLMALLSLCLWLPQGGLVSSLRVGPTNHARSLYLHKYVINKKTVYTHNNNDNNNRGWLNKGTALLADPVVSPFDSSAADIASDNLPPTGEDEEDLELTVDNVELVLDLMRPYLQSDGGDVKLSEIDGPVVKLELVGACGTCPSSSMTMKMGLERKLKERIPEISEVIQTLPDAPAISEEEIDKVLEGVRPFLAVAGGKISVDSITGVGGLQPCITLKMEGSAAALQSVKLEIMQRIQRHFMISLRIEWV